MLYTAAPGNFKNGLLARITFDEPVLPAVHRWVVNPFSIISYPVLTSKVIISKPLLRPRQTLDDERGTEQGLSLFHFVTCPDF